VSPQTTPIPGHPLLYAIDDLLGLHKNVEAILNPETGKSEALTAQDKQAIKLYEEGLQKILDLIAPSAMQVKRNELILGDTHARTLYVYNWPNYIYPNWMSQLINFDAQMDIGHFIYPSSNAAIMKMLRKKVAELRSSIRILEQRGIVRDPSLEAALQDAEELRDLLARGREKLFQFGMYVTLYADDEEKLKKLQTDIESLLGGRLVLTKPAMFQMEHAWTSTLPLALDELEISRNMNTSPLATSFPFSSSDLTDDHGILYGINRHNDSLVIFDRFDLPNANCNVFATSGAGKSFGVKLEILRAMMLGTEVLVIDPENEYVELCKTVGGSFVPMSLQSSFRINPFDLPKAIRGDEAEVGETLRSSVINLHGLFKLMLGTLTPSEDGVLDKAILDTYALKGITLQTADPTGIEPPTMHDLVDVLMTTQGGENMAKVLQKYTDGSYAGIFDKQTNVKLDNQMVVFQIRDLEEQLRPIAIYIVLNHVWNIVRAEMKKRFLVIDEAWNLMQHEDSAKFLYGIVKRARKYYLGITTITQDVEDFVNSPFGKPIITNSSLQILLRQSASAVDNLQKLFYLTDGEKEVLLNSAVGQGIFFAGSKHVAIQIIASEPERKVITTNPGEVLQQRADAAAAAAPIEPPTPPAVPPVA
jgi:type IV secretory pathway VirB4 component